MADSTLYDLSAFPPPQVIEEIDTDGILAQMKADAVARAAAKGIDISGIVNLETEPLVYTTLEPASYREMLVRTRINDAARANLLAFATGSDLDHLAVFYDLLRMPGETDERFRVRIILAIQGRSTGGTAPRYRLIALSASLRVADAVVYRAGTSPVVHVAIYAADNNGVADPALLAQVTAALNDPAVRMVNDTIEVRSAVFQTVNVVANVWLLPETPDTILDVLKSNLRADWNNETGLGFDLPHAWLVARLMRPGIRKVEIVSPIEDVVAQPEQAISIGTINLNNMGRAY